MATVPPGFTQIGGASFCSIGNVLGLIWPPPAGQDLLVYWLAVGGVCRDQGCACGLLAWTVAAPGPPCHCWAVNAVPVSTGARRVCLLLTVAGAVLLMSGVLLVAASGILAGGSLGWRPATLVAFGLIACGLFCGAVLVAVAVPGSRRAGGRGGRPVSPVAAYPQRPERPPRAARSGPAPPARLLQWAAPQPRSAPEAMPAPEALPSLGDQPGLGGQPGAGDQPGLGDQPGAGDQPGPGPWRIPGSEPASGNWFVPEAQPGPGSRPGTEGSPGSASQPIPEPGPAAGERPVKRSVRRARAAPEARLAPEEEWMRALRPDGPPPIRRPPPDHG